MHHKHQYWSFAIGLALAALLIILVVFTGQTFGQRCAVEHERGSSAWKECVLELAGEE